MQGQPQDVGSQWDAGSPWPGGQPWDVGSPKDAGCPWAGGQPHDVGSPQSAGPPWDAGSPGLAQRGEGRRWQRALPSLGSGERDAFCSVAVTMTLRTSSRENSSRNICGTKLEQLRVAVWGSSAEPHHMHPLHFHID